MSGNTLLKIAQGASSHRSTHHERFAYLLGQIERTRKAKAALEASIATFRRAEAQKLQPLRQELRRLMRETLFVLDGLLAQPGWSRIEQTGLKELLFGTARLLLEGDPSDLEVKALYDKHHGIGFDAGKQDELAAIRRHAEEMGFDLGEDDIRSEEDLVERIYDQMKAREEAEQAQREGTTRRRAKSAAQQRAEASAQSAKQFLRELYRKLASAVHPDREADATRRAEKNELMQQINRAYATQDLHTLLEAQMRLERIDPDHVARLSGERLKHYNKLLSQQLQAAQAEIARLEEEFRLDAGLESLRQFSSQVAAQIIRRRVRDAKAHIAHQMLFLDVLDDRGAIKRWLREQRRTPFVWDDED